MTRKLNYYLISRSYGFLYKSGISLAKFYNGTEKWMVRRK
jgi:hypothetical protein